jgi:hypothetical protein
VGISAQPQKVVVSADHHLSDHPWRGPGPGAGLSFSTLYLHSVLDSYQSGKVSRFISVIGLEKNDLLLFIPG